MGLLRKRNIQKRIPSCGCQLKKLYAYGLQKLIKKINLDHEVPLAFGDQLGPCVITNETSNGKRC